MASNSRSLSRALVVPVAVTAFVFEAVIEVDDDGEVGVVPEATPFGVPEAPVAPALFIFYSRQLTWLLNMS